LRFWSYLGFVSFGGPAGQIAILHKEVVEKRRWMSEEHFTSGLSFCTFLPGPEAQQLATYIGWSLHGARGGLAAGILFFLPAAVLLWGLSWLRAAYGNLPIISAVLYGLRSVVVAVIVDAVLRMAGKRITPGGAMLLAAISFAVAFIARTPFPAIVLIAAIVGAYWSAFQAPLATQLGAIPLSAGKEARRALLILLTGASLWVAPLAILSRLGDGARLFQQQYLFFSQAAFVTFGGAYAVLSYVTEAAVEKFRWLSRPEIIDGLALAETTPGPLIMVLQYVGFLAAWNEPHGWPQALSGTIGAVLTIYATFLPSLVLVFLGAPFVERIQSLPRLSGALNGIGAAVIGVIASLGLDYGLAVLVRPGGTFSVDFFALLILAAAFVALRRGGPLGFVLLGGALSGCLPLIFQT
jgi:chromate transporter